MQHYVNNIRAWKMRQRQPEEVIIPGYEFEFTANGNLKTEIKWSALMVPVEVSRRITPYVNWEGKDCEFESWCVRDKYGFTCSISEKNIADNLQLNVLAIFKGSVRVRKGNTYFNVSEIEYVNGNDFEDVTETEEMAL